MTDGRCVRENNSAHYLVGEKSPNPRLSGFPNTLSPSSFKASMGKPTVYHYDTYREELGKAYSLFGYALWDPDPGQYSRVRVGDVGYTQGGKFHRLFNALLSEDDLSRQRLRYGPPEHYEQLRVSFPDHIDRGYLAPNDLHSSGITKTSGGFSGIVPVKG